MKRLRDEPGSSPLLRDAHSLLDAIEPLADEDARMQRVRRALDRPRRSAGALRRVPALVLSGLVVLFGASAFAAVRYIAARSAANEQQPAPAGRESRAKHARAVPSAAPAAAAAPLAAPASGIAPALRGGASSIAPALRGGASGIAPALRGGATASPSAHDTAPIAAPALVPGVPAVAPDAVPADRVSAPVPASSKAPRFRATWAETDRPEHSSAPSTTARSGRLRTRSARARQPAAEAQAPAEPAERESTTESTLVHRAVQALRRDGDPALAARLLAESRAHSANGPLAEEALSLQIEAAAALGNGRSRGFAREYLARYPTGRYASIARAALRSR